VTAKTKIFGIEIVLQDVRPVVSRRVQVPGETTLAELHEVVLFRVAAQGDRLGYVYDFGDG
jgi:hypothetical protein